jgi:predicted amino acid racemase
MTAPRVTVDLDKLEHNTRTIVGLCQSRNIEVCGVTKATCGHPQVALAMLRGGVCAIADSRLENIRRMQAAGVDASYILLRIPSLSIVDDVVEAVSVSLNSEPALLAALSDAAQRRGQIHEVILMVDLGDLREGVWPDELAVLVKSALEFPGIRVRGLGTNLACFGGVVPSEANMGLLVDLAAETEQDFALQLQWLSAINSSGLEMIAADRMPARINHARIGEAILLGRETTRRKPWPGTFQDAFVIHAEVLEVKRKPSRPLGTRTEDAFGGLTRFEDQGEKPRVLLNLGREDVDVAGIAPCEPGVVVRGASSDYTVVDVSASAGPVRVGDELAFIPNYSALLALMTSEYVAKVTL